MPIRVPSNAACRPALLGCSALVAAAMATSAAAQAAGDPGSTLSEIIVTAQKREQSLQDVPIAITAVNQEALKANRIVNVTDLSNVAPGLTVRNTAGSAQQAAITIRGEISLGGGAVQDKAVPIYLDGVYIGAALGHSFDLPTLERIEVLRGPQGTLFGRNSTAGAISIVTRNPPGEFGLRQELTVGNYEQFRTVTRIDTPAWGPIAASISYVHDERTGDIKNLGAGTTWDRSASPRLGIQRSPKTLGDKNVESWFAAVKFEPNDRFNAVYKFDWMENDYTPEGYGLVHFTPVGSILGPFGAVIQGIYDANPAPIAGLHRPKYVNNSFATDGHQKAQGHNVTMNLRVNDSLSFKNIIAYRSSYLYVAHGLTGAGGLTIPPAFSFLGPVGSPISLGDNHLEARTTQWSDEFQANYDSKFLTLTAGALYYRQKTTSGSPENLTGSISFVALPGGVIPRGRDMDIAETTSKAVFLQAEVHVTPQIDLVGGYRFTRDKKPGVSYIAARPFPFSYDRSRPTYLAGVNYKPTQDILVYGKYSTGYLSGGSLAGISYDPETVRSWEGGVKTDLLDRRLRVNLAAFKIRYRDFQQGAGGSNIGRPELPLVVFSFGDAKAKGFEAEVTAIPLRGLTLTGGLSYTDFKLTRVNPVFTAFGPVEPWLRPKWTANVAASYESEPVWGEARVVARLDGGWHSKIASPGVNLPVRPGYEDIQYSGKEWLVNGRLALRDIKLSRGDLEVALWARNLFDNDKPLFPLQFAPIPYLGETSYQPARTFGLDVIYNY